MRAGPATPIRFTRHAPDVMDERRLAREWVEATVRNAEWQESDPRDPAVLRRFSPLPQRGDRVLRVACVETNTEIHVLSAFLDRRARRPR
ncbi:MAG: DUF4258 domain-containing protein [Devosia sp.]